VLVAVDGLEANVQQLAAFHYVCMELAQALDIVPAIQDGWDHHVAIDAVHLVYMDSVPIQEFVYAILDGQVLHVVQNDVLGEKEHYG
jgi:hypothetical protein